MKIKKIITISLTVAILGLISGCSEKYNPSPKALDLSNEGYKKLKYSIEILPGDTLDTVVQKLKNVYPDRVIVNKTKSNIVFSEKMFGATLEDIKVYAKVAYGKNIFFKNYGPKMMTVEESFDSKIKEDEVKSLTAYQLPDLDFKINGKLNYGDLFNVLRQEGVNIYADIRNKEAKRHFSYSNKVPEFSGNLKDFLNVVATKENLFIIHEKDSIVLRDINTVVFPLDIPKTKSSQVLNEANTKAHITLETSSKSSSPDDSTGSAKVSVGSSNESLNPMKDLDKQIKDVLGDKVKYNVNMTSGTLTASGDRESLETVTKIIKNFHDMYGKAISLKLNIYAVDLNDNNSFGVDYSNIQRAFTGVGTETVKDLTTNLTKGFSDDAGTLKISQNGGATFTIDGGDSGDSFVSEKTQGVLFKYLNEYGRTSVLTKPTLGTINNMPAVLNIVDSLDYVYKLKEENTQTTGSQVSTGVTTQEAEVKTIQTGFSLMLHPMIEGDYVKISMESVVSNLNNLYTYTYGEKGNTIQLRDVSARQFAETVKIKEGEIAVVGGYIYSRKHSNKKGLPLTGADDSVLDMFTSAKDRTDSKREIVMTIQASVL